MFLLYKAYISGWLQDGMHAHYVEVLGLLLKIPNLHLKNCRRRRRPLTR